MIVAAIFICIQGFAPAGDLAIIAIILILLADFAIFVRRSHDRGRPGWCAAIRVAVAVLNQGLANSQSTPMLLLLLAFALVQIRLFIETFFRRGKVGPSRYGPDPLA